MKRLVRHASKTTESTASVLYVLFVLIVPSLLVTAVLAALFIGIKHLLGH